MKRYTKLPGLTESRWYLQFFPEFFFSASSGFQKPFYVTPGGFQKLFSIKTSRFPKKLFQN
jgi:hypothetical protein